MKKKFTKYLLLLPVAIACLYLYLLPKAGILPQAGDVAITKTNFPDDIFRQYVQKNFDKDQNDTLSDAEFSSVTEIIVSEMEINSLAGIEYFTNLTKLDCSKNSLTTQNVSKNTALKHFDCSSQHLECKNGSSKDGVFKLDMRKLVGVKNIDSISVGIYNLVKSYEDGTVTFNADPTDQSFTYNYKVFYSQEKETKDMKATVIL